MAGDLSASASLEEDAGVLVGWEAVEATTLAVVTIVVTTAVVVVVAVAGAVGVVVVRIDELSCWTKAKKVASPAGPDPCPSPAFGGIDHSLGPTPLLQRNKKQRKGVRNRQLHI